MRNNGGKFSHLRFAIMLVAVTIASNGQALDGFDSDFSAASERSKKSGRPLFVLFDGSNQLGWFGKFQMTSFSGKVFSHPKFLNVATNAYELVFLDFPSDDSAREDEVSMRNAELKERFKVRRFPTVVLLDANGKEICRRVGGNEDAEEWIGEFQKCVQAKPIYDAHLKVFRDQYEDLAADQQDAIRESIPSVYSFCLPGFTITRLLKSLKQVAAADIPKLRSMQSEIEPKTMPDEIASLKHQLLSEMETRIKVLETIRELDIEMLTDKALEGLRKVLIGENGPSRGWSPVAVALVPKCELPGGGDSIYGVRLNLFGGRHYDVAGLDFGAMVNLVSNNLYGIEFAGLCNLDRGVANGMQVSGLCNAAFLGNGMQASFVNLAGVGAGAQVGHVNLTGKMTGCQVSSGGSVAVSMTGCQICGSGAIAGVGRGCQFSGVSPNSACEFTGVQCGSINDVGNLRGVQISAVNIGESVVGMQIGVVNYATEMHGCQLGLFNVIKTSCVPFLPVFNMGF